MILLPVDPAYALDYLAVLKVKLDHGLDVETELKRVEGFLAIQLGDLYHKVLGSQEFHLSYIANDSVFTAIEKAHKNKVSAREVQQINLLRYKAKLTLQRRFWPHAELMEKKTKL